MIDLRLPVVPPRTTAQQKRVRVVNGRPVFFQPRAMRAEELTWVSLLAPHVPAVPLDGPLALSIRLIYPHLSSVRKADAARVIPKATKPDAGNVVKHLEDVLTRLRFIEDDARIARLCVEKYHGPACAVGITIQIAPFTVN